MLHYNTIESGTLNLLKQLMQIEAFFDMRLVGGTALALQLGHRISIDLDFFGQVDFEQIDLPKYFSSFNHTTSIKRLKNINIFDIDNVKVNFVNYSYPWLFDQINIDGIRLADIKDIAAMKIAAITGRGSKKDFIDLYFLLKSFSLKQMMEFYQQKYFDASQMLALKSLMYFEDAEKEPDTIQIIPIQWETVKNTIQTNVRNFLKNP